jgi:hypothetical protein
LLRWFRFRTLPKLALLLVLGLVAYAGIYAALNPDAVGRKLLCGDEEYRRVLSPDGIRVAIVFERNCGATTDFATGVSIARTGFAGLLSDPHDGFVWVNGQVRSILPVWTDSKTLKVPMVPQPWSRRGAVDGILIVYLSDRIY